MWFWFSLIALLCWSGSDLFSKIGCQNADDKYSQFKMVIAVGVVMGLHAAYEIFIGGTEISWDVIVTYLPVSLLYIVSMTLGYVGLRYIELSISSPICNSSGALVAVLTLITSGIGGLAVGGDALDGAGAFEQVAQVGGGVDAEVVLLQLIDVGVHGLGALRFLHEGQDAQQHLSARGHGFEQVVDALGRRAIIGFRFGLLCGCIGCRADGGVIAALAIIVVRAGVLQRVELVKLGFKG